MLGERVVVRGRSDFRGDTGTVSPVRDARRGEITESNAASDQASVSPQGRCHYSCVTLGGSRSPRTFDPDHLAYTLAMAAPFLRSRSNFPACCLPAPQVLMWIVSCSFITPIAHVFGYIRGRGHLSSK